LDDPRGPLRCGGREVYVHAPVGLARTKPTIAYFDARLATTITGRSWRTVTTLLAKMGGPSAAGGRGLPSDRDSAVTGPET
jgi:hypothetical protein